MSQQRLDHLAATDPQLRHAPRVLLIGTPSDANHAERRCQQRGISLTKIRIALTYGRHDNHHSVERWTLISRELRRSPYARYEQDLNGLQLVGRRVRSLNDGGEVVLLKTCKWNYGLRRH